MKCTLFLLLFSIIVSSAYAQIVSNVSSRLENGKAAVSFALEIPCICTLSYSADGGNTFIPCKNVSGDTDNKTTGTKTIYWDYFSDGAFFGDFLFKVEAELDATELFDMVFIEGENFQMGSNDESNSEKPVHSVSLSDFYIGKTEVTQELWQAVMGNNPSEFKGDNLPVENVSWYDYNSNQKTHPVGTKQPNELGLYDMGGNVWEWCADWYDSGYYKNSPRYNPSGASTGTNRISRGGSWYYGAWSCRVGNRGNYDPGYRNGNLGFRLAVSPR